MTFICKLDRHSLQIYGMTENFLRQGFRKLSYYGLQMHAFRKAWSFPVTWQKWRSHHWIRHTRKPHDTRKPDGSIFSGTGVLGDRSLHWGNRNFRPSMPCSCDLDLDLMTFTYELDPYCLEIYRMCKYGLLTLRLSKVIVWRTDRHTESTEIINHAALQVVNNNNNNNDMMTCCVVLVYSTGAVTDNFRNNTTSTE